MRRATALRTSDLLDSLLARGREFGVAPIVEHLDLSGHRLERVTGEFWTSRQRRGHSLHEVSYRACFKAELPGLFLELLTEPGDLVYDPFMGRGTTPLEAALRGRRVAGNDVNPLSRILLEPRLEPPHRAEVAARLAELPLEGDERAETDLSMFYSARTETQIVRLRSYLRDRRASGEDHIDRWIRMVATNRLSGHSPGFFSVYTMPPNQAVTQESQRKINERRKQTPPDRDVARLIARKSDALLRDVAAEERESLRRAAAGCVWLCQDAEARTTLGEGSVALVVTSPPFLDIVQYEKDNWLRCWFNDLDAGEIGRRITSARTVAGWSATMLGALRELARIVAPGGWVAFEVGEVRHGSLRLDEAVVPLGAQAGLEPIAVIVNAQNFTKTAHCWGISNNSGGTNTNRIVLLRKPG